MRQRRWLCEIPAETPRGARFRRCRRLGGIYILSHYWNLRGVRSDVWQVGQVQEVGEVRCEVLCVGEGVVREAVAALKK